MALLQLSRAQFANRAPSARESFFSIKPASFTTEYQFSLPLGYSPRVWILTGRKALFEYIRSALADEPNEHLLALYLDTALTLLKVKTVGSGSVDCVDFRLSEVLREGFSVEASALILIHNHPSGIAKPSNDDICITRKILEICSYVEMPLLDHLIVTRTEIASVGNW